MVLTYEEAMNYGVKSMTLIRTDRNGTKIYDASIACGKCGGKGVIECYYHVEAGVCFDCMGSCYRDVTVKQMTEEYSKKLEERRAKKEKAKHDAYINAYLANHGFNENGKTYVVIGDTYAMKDSIKAIGGKYDENIGWHIPNANDSFKTFEVDVWEVYDKEIFDKENNYIVREDSYTIKNRATTETYKMNAENSKSKHIYNVKDKVEIVGRIKEVSKYSYKVSYNNYNDVTKVTIEDVNGNIYIWKATNSPFTEEELNGEVDVKIKGTVKELETEKGVPQTILTRCKKV